MSRMYARITPPNAKHVYRQGHSARGIRAAVYGAGGGVEVYGCVEDGVDVFYVDALRPSSDAYGPGMVHARYAIGRDTPNGWERAASSEIITPLGPGLDITYG